MLPTIKNEDPEYPSVKWKIFNQEKMSSKKKADYVLKLKNILA
jgi:hypothetical protein